MFARYGVTVIKRIKADKSGTGGLAPWQSYFSQSSIRILSALGLLRVLKKSPNAKKRTSAAEAALQMRDLRHG